MVDGEGFAQRAGVLPKPGIWDAGMNCSVEVPSSPVRLTSTDQSLHLEMSEAATN